MTTFLWILAGVAVFIAVLVAALSMVKIQDQWDEDDDRWDK